MNDKLIDLVLIVINWISERVKQDPLLLEKIKNGEAFTREDLQRLGDSRDDAIDSLQDALD